MIFIQLNTIATDIFKSYIIMIFNKAHSIYDRVNDKLSNARSRYNSAKDSRNATVNRYLSDVNDEGLFLNHDFSKYSSIAKEIPYLEAEANKAYELQRKYKNKYEFIKEA